jgi:hypothetical protein
MSVPFYSTVLPYRLEKRLIVHDDFPIASPLDIEDTKYTLVDSVGSINPLLRPSCQMIAETIIRHVTGPIMETDLHLRYPQ